MPPLAILFKTLVTSAYKCMLSIVLTLDSRLYLSLAPRSPLSLLCSGILLEMNSKLDHPALGRG